MLRIRSPTRNATFDNVLIEAHAPAFFSTVCPHVAESQAFAQYVPKEKGITEKYHVLPSGYAVVHKAQLRGASESRFERGFVKHVARIIRRLDPTSPIA